MTTTSITLQGHIVGPIWQPGFECNKPVTVSASYKHVTALDLALKATDDGDFQNCQLTADSRFIFTRTRRDGNRTVEVKRVYTVRQFPSIADCVDSRESWELDGEEED